MLKKILMIFTRDLKVNTREAIPLLIIILPLVFAVGINLITPSINDTTVNIAMVKNENKKQSDYFNSFAHIEFFDNRQAVEERVLERDSMLGVVNEAGEYIILAQGNEPETVLEYTKLIKALYEKGINIESFGQSLNQVNMQFVVKREHYEDAVIALNNTFVK